MRHLITDEIWAAFGPMVEGCRSKLGPEPELPDRMFFEAVSTGREPASSGVLPAEFGAWDAVYNRLRCWIHSGRLKELFDLMAERAECEDVRRLMIDSTVVRAHQHAAGARREKGGRGAGSRGGFSTKVIAVACDEDGVLALGVAEGQWNDAPLAEAVLIEARDAVGSVREVLGDEGFDSDAVRDALLDDLDAPPVTPNGKYRKEPWLWDDEMREACKQRIRVERAIAEAKWFRRFASR